MIPFYSKRNQVYPVLWNGLRAVEKHFRRLEDQIHERDIYRSLALPHPRLLEERPRILVTSYCAYPTLLEELERQEREGFCPAPWETLASWLAGCEQTLGQLPEEGNLRNFLWDAEKGQVLGIDFECFRSIPLERSSAALIAALLEYDPADTETKLRAAAILANQLNVSANAISSARNALKLTRNRRQKRAFSGIILAGGQSRRMGQDKAELTMEEETLLHRQVRKMQMLGIEDILLSGAVYAQLPGTRIIADKLSNRGPLGGLHACLHEAKHPACLVLSVDIPLVPVSTLFQLCRAHHSGVTILRHGKMREPLIGVYDCVLAGAIESLIAEKGMPVQALEKVTQWSYFDYFGPEEYLINCNTPEDFLRAKAVNRHIF